MMWYTDASVKQSRCNFLAPSSPQSMALQESIDKSLKSECDGHALKEAFSAIQRNLSQQSTYRFEHTCMSRLLHVQQMPNIDHARWR